MALDLAVPGTLARAAGRRVQLFVALPLELLVQDASWNRMLAGASQREVAAEGMERKEGDLLRTS